MARGRRVASRRSLVATAALFVLSGTGGAQAQSPSSGAAPIVVTVSPAAPARARTSSAVSALMPLDASLTRANHDQNAGYASPQNNLEVVPKSLPAPVYPQGYPTQTTTPVYPQGYAPQAPPPNNYFLPAVQPYGAMPAIQPYGMAPVQPYGAPATMPVIAIPVQPYAVQPFGMQPAVQPFGMQPAVQPFGMQPAVQPFGAGVTPFGGLSAVTNQSVSVPTSRSNSRVRVRGPGMVGSGLARLGERLTQFGRTRIETIQETELETPLSQPSGGVATISSTASTPLIAPQSNVAMPPVQPQGLPVQPQGAPPGPAPSPQGEPTHKHRWWN